MTERGNRRASIFFSDQERYLCLEPLATHVARQRIDRIGHCVMTQPWTIGIDPPYPCFETAGWQRCLHRGTEGKIQPDATAIEGRPSAALANASSEPPQDIFPRIWLASKSGNTEAIPAGFSQKVAFTTSCQLVSY